MEKRSQGGFKVFKEGNYGEAFCSFTGSLTKMQVTFNVVIAYKMSH